MVLDSLTNSGQYTALHPGFAAAFAFLRALPPGGLPDGTYPIDGDRIYAIVQTYQTEPADALPWETHRDYADIQYVLQGEESLGWAEAAHLTGLSPYLPERDCTLAAGADRSALLPLAAGQFAILFPRDAHKPKCALGPTGRVKKVVVKVAL